MLPYRVLAFFVIPVLPSSVWAQLAVRSAASYGAQVSPGSVAALFGEGLSSTAEAGQTGHSGAWPRVLAGRQVEIDGAGAGLLFVSPTQINFVVPPDAVPGTAGVSVRDTNGNVVASGTMQVTAAAPALFSADGSGSGSALAFNRWTEDRGPFSLTTSATPGCDKRTRLSLLGTGLRLSSESALEQHDPLDSNLAAFLRVLFDGPAGPVETREVEYAGPDETREGVDRVDFVLPQALEGIGEASLRLVLDGVESNTVLVPLLPSGEPSGDCVADGFAIAFSTVADLLAGDLWDITYPRSVFARLTDVPEHWPLMGVGTTAAAGHNGEVIVFGTAGMPELIWSDPLFPPAVRTLTGEPIPFVAVAAGNPAHAIVAKAETGQPIHAQIAELAEAHQLAFAGIRVSGRFSAISYSVAYNLLKEGTPLTDPSVDKAPFQLFFDVNGDAQWELSGFYAASPAAQEIVSVRGAPVHIHGFQIDRSRAGHLGNAVVEDATISLYPLQSPVIEDADLAVRVLGTDVQRAVVEVLNRGDSEVTHTTVQGRSDGQVVFQIALPALAPHTSTSIEIAVPASAAGRRLRIVVDPFNDVLESDEGNNIAYLNNRAESLKALRSFSEALALPRYALFHHRRHERANPTSSIAITALMPGGIMRRNSK